MGMLVCGLGIGIQPGGGMGMVPFGRRGGMGGTDGEKGGIGKGKEDTVGWEQ